MRCHSSKKTSLASQNKKQIFHTNFSIFVFPDGGNQNQMSGYYTQDRRNRSSQNPNGGNHNNYHRQASERSNGADTPDFYFMPSQRKYSGEVVRVFVDYNKDPK